MASKKRVTVASAAHRLVDELDTIYGDDGLRGSVVEAKTALSKALGKSDDDGTDDGGDST